MSAATGRAAVAASANWLLRDRRTGRRVVAQRPNLPLLLFVACRLVAVALSGRAADVLHWVGSAALAWWAVDELVRGVNPFRRILGAVVLAWLLVSSFLAVV